MSAIANLQNNFDVIGKFLVKDVGEPTAKNYEIFQTWLYTQQGTEFKDYLEAFLVKLPLKSAMNIASSMGAVLKTAYELASDPIGGSEKLFNRLQVLFLDLIMPETWPKFAMGFVGAHFAEVAFLGSPLSVYALFVAAVIVIAGISADLLITNFQERTEPLLELIREKVKSHVGNLPEAFFTGFFMGSLLGALRRACFGIPQRHDVYIQSPFISGPKPSCIDFPLEIIVQPQQHILNGYNAVSALTVALPHSAKSNP